MSKPTTLFRAEWRGQKVTTLRLIKKKSDQLDSKLSDIDARLDEIKNLLLAPQGRRPGFPKK